MVTKQKIPPKMGMNVEINAQLKLQITDSESIQKFYNLLKKIQHRKFCVGFGIPRIEDDEKEIVKNILSVLTQYGFQNKELDEKIKKSEEIKSDEKN
jgi:hypothetical protein